jgi:hypothetical protein
LAKTERGICFGEGDLPEVVGGGETRWRVCAVWSKASAVVDIELGKLERGSGGRSGGGSGGSGGSGRVGTRGRGWAGGRVVGVGLVGWGDENGSLWLVMVDVVDVAAERGKRSRERRRLGVEGPRRIRRQRCEQWAENRG